jgi:hypothetical protein
MLRQHARQSQSGSTMFRDLMNKLKGGGGEDKAAPLYVLIDPVESEEHIPTWAPHFRKYDEVVGYSVLGHVFMRASEDHDYAVLHPFRNTAKSYGAFADTNAFEEQLLYDPGFAEYVLRPAHVAEVRKHVGPLGNEEVYIPTPYPFIGGSDEPDTYSKGKVWVFLEIVGQMQGLDE